MAKVTVTKDNYEVDRLYQWDMNQVLNIAGLSLSVTPEVHFAHPNDKLAIVRQARMDAAGVVRADIPNVLLQKAQRIDAYVCIYEGQTFQTICKVGLPVTGRAQPSDYQGGDEVEVYSLAALDMEVVRLSPDAEPTVEKVLVDDQLLLRFGLPLVKPYEIAGEWLGGDVDLNTLYPPANYAVKVFHSYSSFGVTSYTNAPPGCENIDWSPTIIAVRCGILGVGRLQLWFGAQDMRSPDLKAFMRAGAQYGGWTEWQQVFPVASTGVEA